MLCSSDLIYHSSWLSYQFCKLIQSNGFVWCLSCVGYWGKKVNIKLFWSFEEHFNSIWRRQTPKQGISLCYGESESTGYRGTQRCSSFPSTPRFSLQHVPPIMWKHGVPDSQPVGVVLCVLYSVFSSTGNGVVLNHLFTLSWPVWHMTCIYWRRKHM